MAFHALFEVIPLGRVVAKIVCAGFISCDTLVQYAACQYPPFPFPFPWEREGVMVSFDSDYSGWDGASSFFSQVSWCFGLEGRIGCPLADL
ncbi:hypothetical protein BDV28DRAFT_140515 [Aspergillus coremiiformis]|uniref:Secreted protein n=1 Tax=Aspergillus coremiiformis TaxID=138285 RepID=A0A5N6YXU7_9EURO|nr:hypothetical protein BDV28DRAFT_140515 [Aspergillus coremiiformis]